MKEHKSKIVEEWEPGMFVRIRPRINISLPAIVEAVGQPSKSILLESKIAFDERKKRLEIAFLREKQRKEIFESGFEFRPFREVQNSYRLLKSEDDRRRFFEINLSPYIKAWTWYIEYDDRENDLKAIVDFLNDEFDKLEVEKNSPVISKRDSFKDFLDERGKLILPQLISKYSGQKTTRLTVMILALISLSLLRSEILSNKSQLNKMLTDTFGYPGDPAGLRATILIYTSPGPDQENEIKMQASIIREFLSSPTTNQLTLLT